MTMRVSRKLMTVLVAGALGCTVLAAAGCSSASANNETLDQRVAAAQLSHEGRYETSGSHGCYGCHGASDQAWPMLATAPQLPAFHFSTENPTSFDDLDEHYQDCADCHIALTGVQEKKVEKQVIAYADEPSAVEAAANTDVTANANTSGN